VTPLQNASSVSLFVYPLQFFPKWRENSLAISFNTWNFPDECLINDDCPLTKACVSKECIDPCLNTVCGSRALCKVEYHTAVCYCPPGLQGNERVGCIEVKCTTNSDCAGNEKCDYPRGSQRKECIPLCQGQVCAFGATCSASNHQEECSCRPPLKGDGYVSCTERKLVAFCYFSFQFELFDLKHIFKYI